MKLFIKVFICFCLSLSLYARGTSSAITINPYFSLGYINPADINDKIESIQDQDIVSFVHDAGKVKWAKSLGAFMAYRFNHRFNVGIMFDYSTAGTFIFREDSTAFTILHPTASTPSANYYEHNTGISAISFGPAFYYTIYSGGKLSLDVGAGFLYALKMKYFADTTYGLSSSDPALDTSPNLHQVSGEGKGYGFLFNVSTAYYFTNYLGLSLDVGYRYLRASSIQDANGNDIYFTYPDGQTDSPAVPMSINFSGIYFGLSLRGEFNLGRGRDEGVPAEEVGWEDRGEFQEELETTWEEEYKEEPKGPYLEELRTLKKRTRRKWYDIRDSKDPEIMKKSERHRKLYDIINKLEKAWDQFSVQSVKEKIEKIKTILNF